MATKNPATAELDEYVRILHAPFEADLTGWRVTSKSAAANDVPLLRKVVDATEILNPP